MLAKSAGRGIREVAETVRSLCYVRGMMTLARLIARGCEQKGTISG